MSERSSNVQYPRAALIAGGSGGIGFAIAAMLLAEGYAVTITGRRDHTVAAALDRLRRIGVDAQGLAGDIRQDGVREKALDLHQTRFGRLDVLVNCVGTGVVAPIGQIQDRHLDLQIDLNLRTTILLYRSALPYLRSAGAEHRNALVVVLSSITGKRATANGSVYSATKAGVVAWGQAMNDELSDDGIKTTVLCPAYVDTPMTDWVKDSIPAAEMIGPNDVSEAVRMLLRLSSNCTIPEICFEAPGLTDPADPSPGAS